LQKKAGRKSQIFFRLLLKRASAIGSADLSCERFADRCFFAHPLQLTEKGLKRGFKF
jgi:hypothetical protein